MDAPDDRDIKLQRASGDLLKEFEAKLPSLLWKSRTQNGQLSRVPHRWAQATKTERLISLLEHFQEWPQLLDPHLQRFLPPLIDAFLAYLVRHRGQYAERLVHLPQQVGTLYPLPRAICKILYVFCKVRGVKVISRFLNNEPKYLEVMLRAFIEWDAVVGDDPMETSTKGGIQPLIWEERYVMLTWLSHLLLCPFDLASVSSDDIPIPHDNLAVLGQLSPDIPRISASVLSVSLKYVVASSKEREAATAVMARLALRPDMQRLQLLRQLTDWAFSLVVPKPGNEAPAVYTCIGALSFLARLVASGQVEDLAPLVIPIFDQTLRIAQEESDVFESIRSSALARKMIIKILRTVTVLVLSLDERAQWQFPEDKVSSILEDAIDYFLRALADKDTPIRFAASKALSVVTLKLEPDMAAEIIEAVIGSLEEDILYEKEDGTLIAPFEAHGLDSKKLKRNLSAVDAQRWQGLVLTLAHLLFRRAPPTRQLPEVLQSLMSGLGFEQRSSTGSSVGTGVRDASCFGIWALSRKYSTAELLALDTSSIKVPTDQEESSVIQMLAVELICAACIDPSGNIRRGASAALQELVGRHPNTIHEGIPLVQVVDYHAVARRSRAMIDVSKGAASLDKLYWSPLVYSLMHWRGIGSPDVESRRLAATAIGELSLQGSYETIQAVLRRLHKRLSTLPRRDIETRHGCLLSIAATIDAFIGYRGGENGVDGKVQASDVASEISGLWRIFDSPYGPSKEDLTLQASRPELSAEASSRLISALSRSTFSGKGTPGCPRPSDALLEKALDVLLLCIFRGEDVAIEASSEAASALFALLPLEKQEETVQGWFANIHACWKSATGRGQIAALGAVFQRLPVDSNGRKIIVEELLRCTSEEELIEKRVSAVKCLSVGVLPEIDVTDQIVDHFVRFLTDYTTDRRGDVGSFVRIEAIQAADIIFERLPAQETRPAYVERLVGCLCRLSAEKLDKVRLQAWLSLQKFWKSQKDFPPLEREYEHFSLVSSPDYFRQLLELLQVDWLRLPLIQGLVTSASAGTENLIRSSRSALIEYINDQDKQRREAVVAQLIRESQLVLESNLEDDRYAIPAMDMLSFLLDTNVTSTSTDSEPIFRKVFFFVQKAHYKSSNMARLEAAIKVYASLSRMEHLKTDVMKKLTSMLLHPYPKIRASVADYLFMETGSSLIKTEDWTMQPKQLKSNVEKLRTSLVK
ncbi:hypothetical protein DTO021D3_71 [Paecilomyces variotii]|nr:hypothetical protein DTO032I3_71 [Paecilomyces variotii]KAJ9282734.1 hypothetical protein DTO021D3_71 [Paecilomyces variotii]KAJ9343977.1 hypothetical protein DTO027B6_3413 [Paecilomyces variotii]KAJ9381830.1 hypothetical protein DTO032I4_6041 [Paecilomyces variotii]